MTKGILGLNSSFSNGETEAQINVSIRRDYGVWISQAYFNHTALVTSFLGQCGRLWFLSVQKILDLEGWV